MANTAQVEEIESMVAIYGKDWQQDSSDSYCVRIFVDPHVVLLHIKLCKDYPNVIPQIEMSAATLTRQEKRVLSYAMEEICGDYITQPVLYLCIEKIRELLYTVRSGSGESKKKSKQNTTSDSLVCPKIYHGSIVTDRKSSFQGHCAIVHSKAEVDLVVNTLKENRKISQAKHNMYAYRIGSKKNGYLEDANDDGESGACKRMLHLLDNTDAENVVVVVTRWYGGIHLGNDRFRHICNVARDVMREANIIQK